MMREQWQSQLDMEEEQKKAARAELLRLERKSEQLVDRIVQADSQTLVTTYENQIRKLEEARIGLNERIHNCGRPQTSFEDTYRTAFNFLANPYELWTSGDIEHKRIVLRLTFAGKLPYTKNEGYRTAETTLPFKVLAGISSVKKDLVGPAGLEPATRPL